MTTNLTTTFASSINAALSSPGIGSGLDVDSIVSKLMSVEQQPLTLLAQQQSSYNAKISAYGSLQSTLSQFQTAMSSLANASQYQAYSATSSNSSAVSATTTTGATAGNYNIAVSQLAQSQQLATVGQSSTSSAIGSGTSTTLSFTFGSISGGTLTNGVYSNASFTSNGNPTQSVVINSSNNTLSGIANAINTANIGVTATIINNGSSTNPYQLLLTSTATGQTSSMQISVSGDSTLSSLLSYNPANNTGQDLTQTVAAQNANMTINGVAVTSPSNTDTNAIQGVTLTLGATTGSTPANVSISQNTSNIVNAVNSFVTAYNSVALTLQTDTSYNTKTKTAGPLNGEAAVNNIAQDLQNILAQPVAGSTSSSALSMLYQAGVTLQNNGTLSVDSTKLQSAIAANPNSFSGLFAETGQTSDSQVNYLGATSSTQPGSYAVNVSQLATQGAATGTAALAASTTITTGSNDTLNVTLDGLTGTVTLAAGTYTPAQLAAEIQSQIDGNSTFSNAGSSVTATVNASGALQLTSNRYGSASNVNITGGNGQSTLSFSGAALTTGVDVAGTINGVAAIGSGQTLTGATGDASSGLQVQVTGGALGARGTVSYSQGYAYLLNQYMTSVLSPTGSIQSTTNYLNTLVQDNQQQQSTLTQQLAAVKARYMAQFTALDTLVSSMNATSSYLTQQLTKTSN